jgi:acyl carrier protein
VLAATATGVDCDGVPVVFVDPPGTTDGSAGAHPGPEDVACVVSGATFTHGALAHALETVRAGLDAHGAGAKPGCSWVCAAPPASLGALTDLLVPLTCGGVAVITTSDLPDAIAEMRDLVAAGAVTHIRSTPLVAERVLAGTSAVGVTAIVDGDRRTARPEGTGRPVSAIEVDAVPGWVALDGEPVGGVGVRVVDADLRPVATGVVGELCVSGAGLAQGFHADPARTADRFVPDPAGASGSRLYRTGLLARFAGDGTLEQLGPVRQHKRVDGHRAELYRIRELLDAQPVVVDSYVVPGIDPSHGRDRLIGYVRTVADASFDANGTRRALAEARVPRHLIPDVLIRVDSWPLTSGGTIDPERLPAPPDTADGPAPGGPRLWDDQFETLLREALATASYEGELPPDMSLADAGLNSFGTVALLVALEQGYDITIPDDVPVVDIFRTPGSLWEMVASLRDGH